MTGDILYIRHKTGDLGYVQKYDQYDRIFLTYSTYWNGYYRVILFWRICKHAHMHPVGLDDIRDQGQRRPRIVTFNRTQHMGLAVKQTRMNELTVHQEEIASDCEVWINIMRSIEGNNYRETSYVSF